VSTVNKEKGGKIILCIEIKQNMVFRKVYVRLNYVSNAGWGGCIYHFEVNV
jgi:hypothetical protein